MVNRSSLSVYSGGAIIPLLKFMFCYRFFADFEERIFFEEE